MNNKTNHENTLFMEQDIHYMNHAIRLAKLGLGWTNPNPIVGAVIVKEGRIIGEGYHARYGELHAERNAIHSLTESAQGATMYVTLEPCCMCAGACLNARLERVVYGAADTAAGCLGSRVNLFAMGLGPPPGILPGVLAEECGALLQDFFRQRR